MLLKMHTLLLVFEPMSCLRVNVSKSAIIPVGEVTKVNVLACFFGCGVDYPSSSYLGLPPRPYKSKAV